MCLHYRRPRFNLLVRKIPWWRKQQPTQVLSPGEFHGQNRTGCSPWNRRESDPTVQLTFTFIHSLEAAAAKSLQSCLTLCKPIDCSPPGLPCPWDSPGKNTGVGRHFLLQCMKVESESDVVQSCPTLSHPTNCSPLGSSVHGMFQARVPEWGATAFFAY